MLKIIIIKQYVNTKSDILKRIHKRRQIMAKVIKTMDGNTAAAYVAY